MLHFDYTVYFNSNKFGFVSLACIYLLIRKTYSLVTHSSTKNALDSRILVTSELSLKE